MKARTKFGFQLGQRCQVSFDSSTASISPVLACGELAIVGGLDSVGSEGRHGNDGVNRSGVAVGVVCSFDCGGGGGGGCEEIGKEIAEYLCTRIGDEGREIRAGCMEVHVFRCPSHAATVRLSASLFLFYLIFFTLNYPLTHRVVSTTA